MVDVNIAEIIYAAQGTERAMMSNPNRTISPQQCNLVGCAVAACWPFLQSNISFF